jgi:uncharacterized LabA/DUF88 family protein
MDIKDIREKKIELERNLEIEITKLLSQFTKETEISISGIRASMNTMRTYGNKDVDYIVEVFTDVNWS